MFYRPSNLPKKSLTPRTSKNWSGCKPRSVADPGPERAGEGLGREGHQDRHGREGLGRDSERLAEASIEPSVGSVGDSYDNALAETVIGLFKTEVIHRRGPWRSFDTVEYATLEWVDWFNNCRLLEPIGNIPPAEAEANYYATLEQPSMAA